MFQSYRRNTHILRSTTFYENRTVYDTVGEEHGGAKDHKQYFMAPAHGMLDKWGYKYTLRIWDT